MELALWILIGVIALLLIIFIALYNKLIILRNRMQNAWAQIDVQLKRRIDLIPNLIETVKGYMKHERTVFKEITEARSSLMKAGNLKEKAKASNQISDALKTIFAVAENYPNLKANENFMMLQEELAGTENKISYSRQFYNDSVMQMNTSVQTFPTNVIANMFGFKGQQEYFEAEEAAKKPIQVKF